MRALYFLVLVFVGLAGAVSGQTQYPYERYRFTTLAGAAPGSADGVGAAARFYQPAKVGVDRAGNVFVADTKNSTIRKITPNGVVSTVAGLAGVTGTADGKGAAARFAWPQGVALDAADNVYISDYFNHTIRKISPAGVVKTLAGSPGTPGHADGQGSAAVLSYPRGMTVDGSGNVYVVDGTLQNNIRKISPAGEVTTVASGITADDVAVDTSGNLFVANGGRKRIDKITPDGVLTTFAGSGMIGIDDGTGTAAKFNNPNGICIDSSGNLYVTDYSSHTIRKVTPSQVVTTVAGTPVSFGSNDGSTTTAKFYYPQGLAVGGAGEIYVADSYNNAIRKISNGSVTTLAGLANQGSADGIGNVSQFSQPSGEAIDLDGNLYVADANNHTIRQISPDGVVTTIAGLAGNPGSSDGYKSAARFNYPSGVAVDAAGNVFVADASNCTIRKITPSGFVTTIAGMAQQAGTADGSGSGARFWSPRSLAVDSSGNIFVADTYSHTIRKITRSGNVTTFAGTADPGAPGSLVDGKGAGARFSYVYGIAIDRAGVLWVADSGNGAIRKITPDANVSTFAGLSNTALALDNAGNIYVADYYNSAIRKINPAGVITTLGGAGQPGYRDGTGSDALFNFPLGIAVDEQGKVYVADTGNHAIRVGGSETISQSLNISTRLEVRSGNEVMIGGLIISGHRPKKVILRAIGPSLAKSAVAAFLGDPALELHDSSGAVIATNHNWKVSDSGNPSEYNGIAATGIAPSDDREAAIVATLQPGLSYTAIIYGESNTTGIGLLEAYDLDPRVDALLANISTRGFVGARDNVMIGGFILGGGGGASKVVIRAIGPSLGAAGISNPLSDPTLELHDSNGNIIVANNDWGDSQRAEIEATGLAPTNDLESAIVMMLSPGNYTAVVAGKGGGSGVGLVEVYNLE